MRSGVAMAAQAKRSNIREIALTSAFNNRNNVIRIPEALARTATQSPTRQERRTICAARIAEPACFCDGVHSTAGANAAIAMKHLFAKICRLGAKLPLVHAKLRAEGVASAWDFKRTPSTNARGH